MTVAILTKPASYSAHPRGAHLQDGGATTSTIPPFPSLSQAVEHSSEHAEASATPTTTAGDTAYLTIEIDTSVDRHQQIQVAAEEVLGPLKQTEYEYVRLICKESKEAVAELRVTQCHRSEYRIGITKIYDSKPRVVLGPLKGYRQTETGGTDFRYQRVKHTPLLSQRSWAPRPLRTSQASSSSVSAKKTPESSPLKRRAQEDHDPNHDDLIRDASKRQRQEQEDIYSSPDKVRSQDCTEQSEDDDEEDSESEQADYEFIMREEVEVEKYQEGGKRILRGDVNDWWRGLPDDWLTVDAYTLLRYLSVARSAPRTPAPASPTKRGRGRPRSADKEVKVYCPHCRWLKNRKSRSGWVGRNGNARHRCPWCEIWTKEAKDPNYVLSEEEQVVTRKEDWHFTLNRLTRAVACDKAAADRKAEKAESRKAKEAKKLEEAKKAEEEAEKAQQEAEESEVSEEE